MFRSLLPLSSKTFLIGEQGRGSNFDAGKGQKKMFATSFK